MSDDDWPRPKSQSLERGYEVNAAGTSSSSPGQGAGYPSQARLLEETQQVVSELKADLMRLQKENSELRHNTTHDAQGRLKELQVEFDSAVEKHKKEVKEARFKTLRLQQERQKLKQQITEIESELAARPPPTAPRDDLLEKTELLEAAVDELRRENAALREEKLAFMTCELKRLHPQDAGSPETGEARLQAALDAAVVDLGGAQQKIRDLQGLNESQEALLDRRTSEYEALLESRRAEVETMHILSHSLDETQARHDEAQEDLAKMQDENRELHKQLMLATVQREHDAKREEAAAAAAAAESACDASTADDSALHEKTLHDLREELAVVKSTASSAISTLSASLKKALLHSEELCEDFEKDRMEMKSEYDKVRDQVEGLKNATEAAQLNAVAKENELQTFKRQMKEAKQHLKAEILDTKKLIKNQQLEVLNGEDDEEFLSLLNIPNKARLLTQQYPPPMDSLLQ